MSEEVTIVCPACHRPCAVDALAVGSVVGCPSCGGSFTASRPPANASSRRLEHLQAEAARRIARRQRLAALAGSKALWAAVAAVLLAIVGGIIHSRTRNVTRTSENVVGTAELLSSPRGGDVARVIGTVTTVEDRAGVAIPSQDLPLRGEKAGDRLEISLGGGVTMAFRWCPRGAFRMGGVRSDERPRRTVAITRGFWIAETELTQLQWLAIMESGLDEQRRKKLSRSPYRSGEDWRYYREYNTIPVRGDRCPMFFISWNDCRELVDRLNRVFRSGDPIRIPTEAEWEYACRAGTTTNYHFGDDLDRDRVAQFGDNWFDRPPAEVASFPANPWGLHDMHGNLWEWCSDWYADDSYKRTEAVVGDPQGVTATESTVVEAKRPPTDPVVRAALAGEVYASAPGGFLLSHELAGLIEKDEAAGYAKEPTKVLRGGSFMWRDCRSANRHAEIPDHRSISVGVRLVLDPGPVPMAGAISKPPAERAPGDSLTVDLPGGIPMEFRWIPAGTFTMGSLREEFRAFDDPPHEVTLTKGFWMGETEVTQAQWNAFFAASRSGRRLVDRVGVAGAEAEDHPVCFVNVADGETFAEHLGPWLPEGLFARLPTEAEWEYACRAGTTTPWHTGEELTVGFANIAKTTVGRPESGVATTPAGRYPANAWGLRDMHGNVWEWCADTYDADFYGTGEAATDPLCTSGFSQVVRGGSWNFEAWGARSGFRNWSEPRARLNRIGLRVVLEERAGQDANRGGAGR